MRANSEIEVKLTASPAMLEELRSHPALAGTDSVQCLHTVYFDTPDARIGRTGGSLRVRQVDGGAAVQTFKLRSGAAGSIKRHEWAAQIAGTDPSLQQFSRPAVAALRRLVDGEVLLPFATLEVKRTARTILRGGSVIEAAFDTGLIIAGKRCRDVCELELELKEGRLNDVIELARLLPLGPDLHWSVSGKAERSRQLAFQVLPQAVHAGPSPVSPAMSARRALQAIAWACLEQFLANREILLHAEDAEAVHQARVALRRMSAAFRSLGPVVSDGANQVLQAELKVVGRTLGQVRDLDVLISRIENAIAARETEPVLNHLVVRRELAMSTARTLLLGAPCERLLFELAGWIESGPWLKAEQGGGLSFREVIADILPAGRRKLRKRAAHLAKLDSRALHRLRKQARSLRYLGEFSAPITASSPNDEERKHFVNVLAAAQDALGAIQDDVAAEETAARAFNGCEPLERAKLEQHLTTMLEATGVGRRKQLRKARKSLDEACNAEWWSTII